MPAPRSASQPEAVPPTPKGIRAPDTRIFLDVCKALATGTIDISDIEVAVKDGEVTLRGTVADRESKMKAVERTERVQGVGGVQNELRVKNADVLDAEPELETK